MSNVVLIAASMLSAVAAFGFVYWLATFVQSSVSRGAHLETTVVMSPLALPWHKRLVLSWAASIAPRLPKRLVTDLERRIVQAGGLSGVSPSQIIVWAGVGSLASLALGLLFIAATGASATWALMLFVVGTLLPFLWLRDQVQERHFAILADLPFHLDLLTLCVEAGLDFTAGVMKMVDKGRPGPLRDEFQRFLSELRIGKTRAEALDGMSVRVGLPQLSGFLSALIQAERMGSGLSKALRAQSEQLRIERFQRAETKAGEAPVKMLLPLVLFIFPTIWIILAAPLVFEWIWK